MTLLIGSTIIKMFRKSKFQPGDKVYWMVCEGVIQQTQIKYIDIWADGSHHYVLRGAKGTFLEKELFGDFEQVVNHVSSVFAPESDRCPF